ncbi:hypothetical protein, partial [Staphylococcus aureus]
AEAKVTLTADVGFKIQSAQVVFYDGDGDPASKAMIISDVGKSATWQSDACEPDKGVTISGETVSEGPPIITEVKIKTYFSNCYAAPEIPESL